MMKRFLWALWLFPMAIMIMFGLSCATAQLPEPPAEIQSSFDTVEAPVLKVFSVEEDGHRFVAYMVKWNDSEVIVSDPLARSHVQEGDRILFMAQKLSLPGERMNVSSLNFHLLNVIESDMDKKVPEEEVISPEERNRQMKVAKGDLDAAKTERDRFYALNRASRNALKNGEMDKARELAIEQENLLPKYKDDWNYGNAVQDTNQVLGWIALESGDSEEAKKRLLDSADSGGSPQMNSFGPNMHLAKALLEKGERDVVLEYFKRCSTFWEMGEVKLAAWTATVKKGEIPDFGANLVY